MSFPTTDGTGPLKSPHGSGPLSGGRRSPDDAPRRDSSPVVFVQTAEARGSSPDDGSPGNGAAAGWQGGSHV